MITKLISIVIWLAVVGMQSNMSGTYTTSYFRLKYEKNISLKDIQKIGSMLEKQYTASQKKLNLSLNQRVDVLVYNSPTRFQSEAQSRAFDDGAYRNGRIYLSMPVLAEREMGLQNVISRLVSRAILGEVKACPEWLAEAYGLYAGNELLRFGQPARFTVGSFSDLSEDYAHAEVQADVKEVYAKLAATANFLVSHYGEKKVNAIFTEFKRGESLEDAFEFGFGEKTKDVEKAWVKSLRSPIK